MPSPDVPAAPIASPENEGIVPETARQVRKAIYSHAQLTPSDMDLVFSIAQRAGRQPCPEWTALFCEALTDYVVHQNDPPDYIPQDKADWLAARLAQNGGIGSRTEFAMLIDLMTHALDVPTSLATFALGEVKTAIIKGRRDGISGEDHPPGIVTQADVETLRAILYAAKTGTPGRVTRDEAEVLFEIAHTASQADPSFDDLFARAIGNYLMAINLHVPDAAEALHVEKWLEEKDDLPGFLSQMLHRPASVNSFNVLETPANAYEADMAQQNSADMAQQNSNDMSLLNQRENIPDSETAWVIAHLTCGSTVTSAETRLLQFLGAQLPSIAPPLRALIDKANKAAVASGPR